MTRVFMQETHDIFIITRGKGVNNNWVIAKELNKIGLKEGEKIASISYDTGACWARLSKLMIVAELISNDENIFWSANEEVKTKAIKAFANSGAKAIVACHIPEYATDYAKRNNWKRIADTGYYVYVF